MPFSLSKKFAFSILRLDGIAAIDFGHRMFSRDIRNLKPNEGALATFLSAEGKIQESFWVLKQEGGLLILAPSERAKKLADLIEKYHFAEAFTTLVGPEIASYWEPGKSDTHGMLRGQIFEGNWRGTKWIMHLNHKTMPDEIDFETWELHRIQNLIPEYAKDYDENSLVFDLGFEELCDPGKGCYIGQEVVERVRSRGGHFPRRLSLFSWSDAPVRNSIVLNSNHEPIGTVTSSQIKTNGKTLGLGFLKRQSAEAGMRVFVKESSITGEVVKIEGA